MIDAWMFVGAARAALRRGDRIVALLFLSCAARERRRAMATLEVQLRRPYILT